MTHYVGLSPNQCDALYWQHFQDYSHAAQRHLVPVTAPEAATAAAHLPLVFARTSAQSFQLVALLGLAEGTNHCVDAQHRWLAGYVPALERTHPFRVLPTEKGSTQRTLCVDMHSPWVTSIEAEPFFTEDGQLAPKVQEVLSKLTQLETHFYKTQQAVDALVSHNLLSPWQLDGVGGEPVKGVYRIDEHAFNALGDAEFSALRKQGAVAIAYTQMISSHHLPALKERAEKGALAESFNLDDIFGDDDEDLSFSF